MSASMTFAGTIKRPRTLTAGNSPSLIARYIVIGDVRSIAAVSLTV